MARCILCSVVLLLTACASFRPPENPPQQFSLQPAAGGPLAELAAQARAGAEQDESAFWLLESSRGALQARMALFDEAITSLDLQYFIWQDDLTAYFLLERILAAADRGVRVRLLVDDYSASGRDREFFALAQHDNVEVRSFNASRARRTPMQVAEFAVRFGTLNHRMHNKAILADGHIGIVGGRNIGDRYFGIHPPFIQYDLDIMFAGDIVAETQRSFDAFWNSSNTVVIHDYLRPRRRVNLTLNELRGIVAETVIREFQNLAGFTFRSSQWLEEQANTAMLAPSEFIYDSPEIESATAERLKDELYEYLGSARDELVLISAYVIPDEELLRLFEDLRDRGVHIVILTNSVQSNNHMLAHVAYKRFRRRLLRAGIELFEMRPDAAILRTQSIDPVQPGYLGLHMKAAVVDDHYAMVGTANIDPRALDINTESALLIDDAEFSEQLRTIILEATAPANAWQLGLDESGKLTWTHDSEARRNEPVRGPLQRILQFLHVLLPIKDQA